MTIKHTHQSAIADDGSDVGQNAWNADHALDSSSLTVQYNSSGSLTGDARFTWAPGLTINLGTVGVTDPTGFSLTRTLPVNGTTAIPVLGKIWTQDATGADGQIRLFEVGRTSPTAVDFTYFRIETGSRVSFPDANLVLSFTTSMGTTGQAAVFDCGEGAGSSGTLNAGVNADSGSVLIGPPSATQYVATLVLANALLMQNLGDGQWYMAAQAGSTSFMVFGGYDLAGTSPAFKNASGSTTLQVRLSDDSAFTNIQGKLTTHAAAVAETITPDSTIILYDSNGTAYKVPCVAA